MYRTLILTMLAWAPLAACGGDDALEPLPLTVLTTSYDPGAIFSVWSSSPNDVWAVGGEQGSPVVLRYDGARWTRNDPPIAQQLWWVSGFVGGPVFVAGEGGALARWTEGSGWDVFDAGFEGTTFYGVWGASPDDVWAVGGPYAGAPVDRQVGDVILHFDGTAWSRVSVPALEMKPASAQKNLFKVWGASADRVFVVGSGGLVLHYDGTTWTSQPSGFSSEPLFTVIGRSATDVYAVGGLGSAVLAHWDGNTWSPIPVPDQAPPVIQGLWTAPGQPVVVAGYYGFFAIYDGKEWAVTPPTTDLAFHGVWGDGQGIWAGGGNIVSFSPDYTGALAVSGRTVPAP